MNSTYWKKRNLVKTNKWATGYLTPDGNKQKEELDKLNIIQLQEMCLNLGISHTKDDIKDDLILSIIHKNSGISKMKVNNQVASNPIGYYEASKNFANLPCRLTHFTRTNYDKYNNGLPFIQRINQCF